MLLYCPVRQVKIKKTPEEVVRQSLIEAMTKTLGYPLSQLTVEKELEALPHLSARAHELPNRRIDLLVSSPSSKWEFSPLLLIECKEHAFSQTALDQAMGYNHYIQAPFVAIAGPNGVKTFWRNKQKQLQSIDFLPLYNEILRSMVST